MREFQEKRKIKGRIYSKTSLAILFIVLVLVTRGVVGVYAKEQESQQDLARVATQKNDLQIRAAAMQQDTNRLESPEGVEAEIRSKFDVAKPGEEVVVVVDNNATTTPPQEESTMNKFWDSVKSIFKRGGSVTASSTNASDADISANAAAAADSQTAN